MYRGYYGYSRVVRPDPFANLRTVKGLDASDERAPTIVYALERSRTSRMITYVSRITGKASINPRVHLPRRSGAVGDEFSDFLHG